MFAKPRKSANLRSSALRFKWIGAVALAFILIQLLFSIAVFTQGDPSKSVQPIAFKRADKKYLLLKGVAGRFGNALLQFKNAAIMARTLDRILVSSIDFQTAQDVNIFDVFDIDVLKHAGFMIEKECPELNPDILVIILFLRVFY